MSFGETWGHWEEPDPYTCVWFPASSCLSKLRLVVATLEEWKFGNTAIPFQPLGILHHLRDLTIKEAITRCEPLDLQNSELTKPLFFMKFLSWLALTINFILPGEGSLH